MCNWENLSSGYRAMDNHLNLGNYFVLRAAYRITPFDWSKLGYVDIEFRCSFGSKRCTKI